MASVQKLSINTACSPAWLEVGSLLCMPAHGAAESMRSIERQSVYVDLHSWILRQIQIPSSNRKC
jgi:hypothetical protein